jgi:hypothetical protein
MPSSGMLRRVALVRTEHIASIISMKRIDDIRRSLAETSKRNTLQSLLKSIVTANVVRSSPILVILMMEAICSVPTRATRRNFQEDDIHHSSRCEKTQILYSINYLGSVAKT